MCSHVWPKLHFSADVFNRNVRAHTPEKEYEGQKEGPEVVVLVDGTFTFFFNPNIPKELAQHNKHVNAQLHQNHTLKGHFIRCPKQKKVLYIHNFPDTVTITW